MISKVIEGHRSSSNFSFNPPFPYWMVGRFGSEVANPDLDGEVLGSSPGQTKDFKNNTYCSSACAGHNELE